MPEPGATARPALHHVAFATRDLDETHRFYHEGLGLPLVHTELTRWDQGYFRHLFYDLGDGSAIAFFDLHDAGEPTPIRTAISTDLGLPAWVNHIALRVDETTKPQIVEQLAAVGYAPEIEIDHGWCVSAYLTDPNGILVELCLDRPGIPVDEAEAERLMHATPDA
ncbi:MAG: VOC family protein [Acidimicrobiales bacterium]|nr:VOC family protein [Acidimicrobiales bacterium]MCB1248702.1 VOC family protein [Acidimicrobiales bacterium]